MEIPRFSRNSVSSRLLGPGEDDAFQRFVGEVLRPRWPNLRVFPAAGKDGAIDLSQTGTTRAVLECKLIGEDDIKVIKARWKEVAEHLTKNLASPNGPPSGQSQYAPWYRPSPVINEYVFCVSASLKNQARRDEIATLQETIAGFFHDLATKHPHLSHLLSLKVEVIDWDDLVKDLPLQLVFRWFPRTRPNGLKPFGEEGESGSFRSYLRSDKLPYYSRSDHLQIVPPPTGVSIPDENALLQFLGQDGVTGLIISGAGGVGKSRLMCELGHLARHRGSTVLEVAGRLKPDALESLAERLTSESEVLLLIDYIETQHDFIQLVEEIESINASGELRLRYVACCRSTYFSSIKHGGSTTSPYYHLDLAFDPRMEPWLKSYRSSTVQHILDATGLLDDFGNVEMCGETPVFAVFLAWLHDQNRREELAELLHEQDFGHWLSKRVQKSFQEPVNQPLAQLACLFPMSNHAALQLRHEPTFDRLFERLLTDGWIERTGSGHLEEDVWQTAHDVLADQIVLSYSGLTGPAADQFILRLFELATDYDLVESALITFQRISDFLRFDANIWEDLLRRAIQPNASAWQKARSRLLTTSLLSASARIRLLKLTGLWAGAELEVEFQNQLGWLARAERALQIIYDPEIRNVLKDWIRRSAPFVERSNFLLTFGLQFDPDAVQEFALRWLTENPDVFQSHYLIVRWLRVGLSPDAIADMVIRWIRKFAIDAHLSFVASAWLDASGDLELVQEPIRNWLNAGNQTALQAQFVYKSWLDAGGNLELVQESIMNWLNAGNQTVFEAGYVYKSWLDAGGNLELVQEPIMSWLNAGNQTTIDAGFVYKSWLDAGGNLEIVREPIKNWLDAGNQTALDAGFVYKSWLDARGDLAFVQEPIRNWLNAGNQTALEAQFVYKSWLDAGGDLAFVQEPIKNWLDAGNQTTSGAGFVYPSWLDAGGNLEFVQEPIKKWLNAGNQTALHARFVYKSWLDAGGNLDLVEEPIKAWLSAGNERDPDADFLVRAWLDAGGNFESVREPAIAWLHSNCTRLEAAFITKSLTNQSDLPDQAILDILSWCRSFPENEDAVWRLSRLNKFLTKPYMADAAISTGLVVLRPLLQNRRPFSKHERSNLKVLFHVLIVHTRQTAHPDRANVDHLVDLWCRHPATFVRDEEDSHLTESVCRMCLFRISTRIAVGGITIENDRAAIERIIDWFNSWLDDWKNGFYGVFAKLKRQFPDDTLWGRLQF